MEYPPGVGEGPVMKYHMTGEKIQTDSGITEETERLASAEIGRG